MDNVAILTNDSRFTKFSFNGVDVRFKTSPKLERYINVLEWDNGYIVVTARYAGVEKEEYIDLIPILNNLYIEPDEFLKNISEVRVCYDKHGENGR